MDEIEELRIQLKLEKLKSSIYRDIIDSNTNIRISLTQPENIITLFNELYIIFTSKKIVVNVKENIEEDKNDKKNSYKTFKNCIDLVEEPSLDEQNNKIVEVDRSLQDMRKEFTNLSEAKIIFDECFESIKKERTYTKALKTIKSVRLNIIGIMTLDEYLILLQSHFDKLTNIFIKEKQISEKLSYKHISQSMSSIDLRLKFFLPYYISTPLDIDDLSKLKTCLKLSVNFPKHFKPFSHDDFYRLFFNYGTSVCTIKECIERNLINIYGYNNVVYIPITKSTDNDPFSFYYLKKIDKIKRYWHMDCRLEDLSNKFIDNIRPYLIELFRKLYFDAFSDYDYRNNFLYKVPDIELDLKQLMQNICILSNPKKFNKYLRNIIKDNATYNATNNDIKNFSSDDSSQKRRFENEKELIDPVETVKLLFDNISTEDAVDFYRSINIVFI
jgi:hypothetical protein